MKVRTIEDAINTHRHVKGKGFDSIRLLLADDGMGFSVHKTIIPKGGPYHWHYKHHLEACYCISGSGILHDKETARNIFIQPETIYILDKNDNHEFEAIEDTVLLSIFNPPVIGSEVHGEDGSYSDGGYYDLMANDILNAINYSENDYDAKESIIEILKSHNNDEL